MRDRCIVVGEEGWVGYTILKVGEDKEVGSIVCESRLSAYLSDTESSARLVMVTRSERECR